MRVNPGFGKVHLLVGGLILASGLCLLVAGCARQRGGYSDGDRRAAVEQVAQSVLSQRGVPGIAIAVLRDGRMFDRITAGSADRAAQQPVTGDTPFQLASTTKIFTATAVMTLVADGKAGLDDSIGAHLSDLPASWRSVTIRELLSHTSGLPDITRSPGELDLVAADWGSALPIVAAKPFQFSPGTAWAYTQTNYAILQRLVERLSGQPFEAYLGQRLFRPLGMRNTFFPTSARRCARTTSVSGMAA